MRYNLKWALKMLPAVWLLSAATAWGQVEVDPELPVYTPVEGVSGSLKSIGSDTMNNLMTLWTEGFRKYYPNVTIEVEGKGSSTAPPALIAGTADFGPMSREMKSSESDEFESKFGYKPTGLPTSIDMLAVYVNKDNPIASLTLGQVDAIFSSTRNRGHSSDITTWGQAGLKQKTFVKKRIAMHGRNSASGTYLFFKEHVLAKGDYKPSVNEQPGSSNVVNAVGNDRFAIGYSGIGYITPDVRAVPLQADEDSDVIPAEPEYAYTGEYPLSRFLFVYFNYKPGSELPPLQREFIKYIFSQEGQEVVIKDGYFPVTADIARRTLESVGLAEAAGQ